MSDYTIARLDSAAIRSAIPDLADVLVDCVEGGASVGFMSPIARETATGFWERVADAAGRGEVAFLAAIGADGRAVGTVHLRTAMPENQPHRAEVTKMLVHSRARRQGIGAALMTAVEALAASLGKTVLVLDTVTGEDAERLYKRLGWQVVGIIPNYALYPDGRPCPTTVFYKTLTPPEALDSFVRR